MNRSYFVLLVLLFGAHFTTYANEAQATAAVEEVEPVEQEESKEPEAKESGQFDLKDAIQPRKEDAFWLYRSVYFEEGKPVSNGSSREQIMETTEIEGVTCYHVRVTMDWRSIIDRLGGAKLTEDDYWYFWDYASEKGSFHFDPEEKGKPRPEKLSDFSLNLPYPVEKGKAYKVDETEYLVVDTARKVKVPAGEFECVVYEMTYPEQEEDDWKSRDRIFMAKGVGMVVAEGDVWEDGKWVLDYRDELTSYDLNLDAPEKKEDAAEKKAAPEKAEEVLEEKTEKNTVIEENFDTAYVPSDGIKIIGLKYAL